MHACVIITRVKENITVLNVYGLKEALQGEMRVLTFD
jgi:hypothetical protein